MRTWLYTTFEILGMDNCNRHIAKPLWHISTTADRTFNHELVVDHLKIIYSQVFMVPATINSDATTIPSKIRHELARR